MTNAVEIASSPSHENDPSADPFSSDVFGPIKKPESPYSRPKKRDEMKTAVGLESISPAWATRLPKVSRKLLRSSIGDVALRTQLPDILAKATQNALTEVVFAKSGSVHCALEAISECDLLAETAGLAAGGNLSIQIVFEPTQAVASVVVNSRLVRTVIDEIIGPSDSVPSNKISPIEMAIVEFLAARIVGRINDSLGSEVFSVFEASLAASESFREHEAGAKARVILRTDSFSKSFRILMSQDFLSGLAIFDAEDEQQGAAELFDAILSIPLRAQVGWTKLDATTLSFLEPGDVVIVEKPQVRWNHGSPSGEVKLLAGAGNNFVLTGEIESHDDDENDRIRVLLKDISSREAVDDGYTTRFIMEEKKQVDIELDGGNGTADKYDAGIETQENDELSASLENLQLRLRVELAGKKISLREINSLRPGQVIDLERGLNDSVNLVTDGSDETVAVGELVDIEGRLGVRLIKVFL